MISNLYKSAIHKEGYNESYIGVYSDGIRFLNFNDTLFITYDKIIDHTFNGIDQITIKSDNIQIFIKSDAYNSKRLLEDINNFITLNRIRFKVLDIKSNYIVSVHLSEDRNYYANDQSYDIFTNQIRLFQSADRILIINFDDIQSVSDSTYNNKPSLDITHKDTVTRIITGSCYLSFIKELILDYQEIAKKSGS